MNMIKLFIDFSKIKTIDDFHSEMKELFGFPDGYGKNFNAFIDCLTSLRIPEDGMTNIHIQEDECILLEIMNLNSVSDYICHDFLLSIQSINERCKLFNESPLVLLLLCKSSSYRS